VEEGRYQMKETRNTLVYWVMAIEFLCIVLLCVYVFVVKQWPLKKFTYYTSPIRKEYLLFPENSTLQHYYEASAGAVITYSQDWMTEDVVLTMNSEGLNEPYDYPETKPPATFRIMTLGDSFTFGDDVHTKDNWPEQLEATLKASTMCGQTVHFEVINLGMYGYDMQYELERFTRVGLKYQPDVVIWFLHGDKWNELLYEKMLEKQQQLTKEDRIQARLQGNYYPEWTYAADYVNSIIPERQAFEQYRLFMKQFSSLYPKKLLIMTLSDVAESYKARLKFLVSERGNPTWYYDRLPQLQKGITMYPDGHPNESWYKETAGLLADFMQKEGIVTCPIR
jgi:hypothetical protein